MQQWKEEIRQAEAGFAAMAAQAGIKDAFLAYAAEDAVLNRGGKLIRGRDEIAAYFDSQTLKDVRLEWSPSFIDVAASGDMAYTYGPFTFSAVDTAGVPVELAGHFHTVWKRQADGSWKFVYD